MFSVCRWNCWICNTNKDKVWRRLFWLGIVSLHDKITICNSYSLLWFVDLLFLPSLSSKYMLHFKKWITICRSITLSPPPILSAVYIKPNFFDWLHSFFFPFQFYTNISEKNVFVVQTRSNTQRFIRRWGGGSAAHFHHLLVQIQSKSKAIWLPLVLQVLYSSQRITDPYLHPHRREASRMRHVRPISPCHIW